MQRFKTVLQYRPFEKMNRLFLGIVSGLIFLSCAILLELVLGNMLGIGIICCTYAFYYLCMRRKNWSELTLVAVLIGMVYGYLLATFLLGKIELMDAIGHRYFQTLLWFPNVLLVSLSFTGTICIWELLAWIWDKAVVSVRAVALSIITMNMMFFLFIPLTVMLGNVEEYSFPFYILIASNIGMMIHFIVWETLAFSFMQSKWNRMGGILSGFLAAIYVQYMFLNGVVGQIAGAAYDWHENYGLTIFNLFIWLVLIVLIVIIDSVGKKKVFTRTYLPMFLMLLWLISCSTQILMSPKEIYQYRYHIFKGEEQYTVSAKENVILFILDSADNSFLKNLMQEGEYDFSEFRDFCMYTNTCSVYDITQKSIPQMMTGASYDDYPTDYMEAYRRMKEAGYTIHFYGYEGTDADDMLTYVDNYDLSTDVFVDYNGILRESMNLTKYLIYPNILKKNIDISQIHFADKVSGKHAKEYYYDNELYYRNLELTVNPDSDKYFIMEHLDGVHEPNAGNEIVLKYCLDIMKEYIAQLKELGLYEQATIIITADHGLHDDMLTFPYPTASTPMFLIKCAGQTFDTMQIRNAPIYHTDILPTILKSMNLYGEDDGDIFGKTIWDFGEDEKRSRSFYNRGFKSDAIYEYRYIGETKDLEKAFEQEQYILK